MNMENAISPDYDQSLQNSETGGSAAGFFFFFFFFFVLLLLCSIDHHPDVPKTETNDGSPSAVADRAAGDSAGPIQIVIQRDALPLCTFHQLKDAAAASSCAICLADYNGGEAVRMLPECCHVFHRSCIDPWLRIHATCPACRNPTPPPLPEAAAQ